MNSFIDVDKSIYNFQKDHTNNYSDEFAYRYYKKNISYSKSKEQIESFAKMMKKRNVKKGDVVAVISPMLPEVASSFYGINKNGAIFFPIDPRVNPLRMKEFLNLTETKHVIMFDQVFGKLDAIIDDTNVSDVIVISAMDSMFPFLKYSYHFDQMRKSSTYYDAINKLGFDDNSKVLKLLKEYENKDTLTKKDKSIIKNLETYKKTRDTALKNLYYSKESRTGYMNYNEAKKEIENIEDFKSIYDKDIPASLTFTSGTTGKPKLVPTMNRSYNVKVRDYSHTTMPIEKGDRMLGMPPFIMYGEVFMHMAYTMGVQNVIIPDFIDKYYPDIIKKEKVNHAIGVPAHALALAKDEDFNKNPNKYKFLKTVSVGGGKMLLKHEQEINNALKPLGIKVTQGYSMSELTPSSTTNMPHFIKEGSVGMPLGDCNLLVVNPETMEPVEANQSGVILVNSETQFTGYYKNPEASKKVFVEINGVKYVNTEDRGYFDEDGYYYIVDRYKDMITGPDLPHNIFPKDLEEVLIKSPLVEDCAVVGMPYPDYDSPRGEYPKAHVVLKEPYQSDTITAEEKLKEFCLENLPENEVPKFYRFHEALPLTPVLKPDTLALKELDKKEFEEMNKGYSKVKK